MRFSLDGTFYADTAYHTAHRVVLIFDSEGEIPASSKTLHAQADACHYHLFVICFFIDIVTIIDGRQRHRRAYLALIWGFILSGFGAQDYYISFIWYCCQVNITLILLSMKSREEAAGLPLLLYNSTATLISGLWYYIVIWSFFCWHIYFYSSAVGKARRHFASNFSSCWFCILMPR